MDKSIHTNQYKLMVDLLREERISHHLTQEQLASKLNIKQSVISKIETCERRIDFIELRQICLAIGLSLINFINKFEERIEL